MASNAKSNIFKLLKQAEDLENKKQILIDKLKLIQNCDMNNIDEIDEIESEINFLNNYQETLKTQAIVIMNEHKVYDIDL